MDFRREESQCGVCDKSSTVQVQHIYIDTHSIWILDHDNNIVLWYNDPNNNNCNNIIILCDVPVRPIMYNYNVRLFMLDMSYDGYVTTNNVF